MQTLNGVRLKKKIDGIVYENIKKGVFSGCCVSFSKIGKLDKFTKSYSYGYTEKEKFKFKVKKETFFDLASLTKPLVTTLSIAALIEDGLINIEDTLPDCCNWIVTEEFKKISIYHLLSHSSGLPAHKPYYDKLSKVPINKKKEQLKKWILAEKLSFAPGTDSMYSDLGFILLGFIVEEKSACDLDIFWQEQIMNPLKLQKGLFFAGTSKLDTQLYTVTGRCKWSNIKLCGIVHDDNCRALGGVAGHAGLFGTADAVLSVCEHIINVYKDRESHPCYNSNLLRELLTRRPGYDWCCGFDRPTVGLSSSGTYFGSKSRGHLGFTGTSFWIDLDRNISIVVLTNRVHLSSNINMIKEFRPRIHDVVMEEILGV